MNGLKFMVHSHKLHMADKIAISYLWTKSMHYSRITEQEWSKSG